MAEYTDPVARDILREHRQLIESLQREVETLRAGRGGAHFNRQNPADVPNPYEGQTTVDLSNVPRHYAEGQWREFGGFTVEYAYISQILDQEDPIPTDVDDSVFAYGPATEGFTSDETILWPNLAGGEIILNAESAGNDPNTASSGYCVLATSSVAGWDNWSGGATEVLDAVKGCGFVWNCPTIDQRQEVVNLQPASGTAGVPDSQSVCADMNIVQSGSGLHNIYPLLVQYSGVDAIITQMSLFVAVLRPYTFQSDPSFGKWFIP